MKVIKVEMTPFILQALCECGGKFLHTGEVLTCIPPLYPHECESCEKIENFEGILPQLIHEVKNNFDYLMQVKNVTEKPND